MNAWRELDAMVAEKVMGWRRVSSPAEYSRYYGWFRIHDQPVGRRRGPKDARAITTNGKGSTPSQIRSWQPSENIEDAWVVVEKLRGHGHWLHLSEGPPSVSSEWYGKRESTFLARIGEYGYAEANTVPHAICLAALAAVGVEVPA